MAVADPADTLAQARRELGHARQLQQTRRVPPNSSLGGSTGYPVFFREQQLERSQNGEAVDVSRASIYNWRRRLSPYRQTGNTDRTQVVGVDQLLLVDFIIAHPDATHDEIATFIFNEGGGIYSRQTLSKRMADLQITKKKASREAYKALEPRNQLRVHLFFNRALLLGICGEPRYKLIDADEFNFSLVRCNRTRAWALKCYKVRKHGHYSKGGVTFSDFLAIELGDPRLPPHIQGSIAKPRLWFKVIQNGGATVTAFRDFVDYICTDIEQNRIPGTDDHRIFLWDNLNSHLSHYVTQTVEGRPGPQRFSTCPRPLYQPKYGPVEYKICDIVQDMKLKAREEWTMASCEAHLYYSATKIGPFDSTFEHCGYKWT